MDRLFKQVIIGGIYIAMFSGIYFGAKTLLVVGPTCTDGIRNQSEQGVDCGPVCGNLCAPAIQPLTVEYTELLRSGQDQYDVVARIDNPNIIYGSGRVSYELNFRDAQGSEIVGQTQTGTLYIMPNQRRYFILTALRVNGNPYSAELVIKDAVWQQINIDEAPDVNFSLRRETFTDKGPLGAVFEGVLLNDSDFDFTRVDIGIILLNELGRPVAVNSTDVRTLVTREERYFKVEWTTPVPSSATRVIDAVTNIFLNENFIKRYGSQENFQQYR